MLLAFGVDDDSHDAFDVLRYHPDQDGDGNGSQGGLPGRVRRH